MATLGVRRVAAARSAARVSATLPSVRAVPQEEHCTESVRYATGGSRRVIER